MFGPSILVLMTSRRPVVRWRAALLGLCLGLTITSHGARGSGAIAPSPQDNGEVAPEAPAEILWVTPGQAQADNEVTLEIDGRNFARGVYVSFLHPAVQVLATKRMSDERLETRVAIGSKVPSGAMRLYVSNSTGPVAESQLVILGGVEPPAAPRAASLAAAGMKAGLVAAKPPPESPRGQSAADEATAKAEGPEVTAVEPQRALPGSEITLKITGKNFAQGATVAFSNPGIRVLETNVGSEKEITVAMKLAEDAPTGPTGLFVVNPDDSEAEFPFEVAKESPEATAPPQSEPESAEETGVGGRSFEVPNIGEGIDIFQNVNKPKGTLGVADGKVKYEEAGEEISSAPSGDIKEVDVNTVLGVNTGTFHLTLNSGKTFNLVPASLRPAETQSIIEALCSALK